MVESKAYLLLDESKASIILYNVFCWLQCGLSYLTVPRLGVCARQNFSLGIPKERPSRKMQAALLFFFFVVVVVTGRQIKGYDPSHSKHRARKLGMRIRLLAFLREQFKVYFLKVIFAHLTKLSQFVFFVLNPCGSSLTTFVPLCFNVISLRRTTQMLEKSKESS